MAAFTEKTPFTGFDSKVNPPWQMLSAGGGLRVVRLQGGAGLQVELVQVEGGAPDGVAFNDSNPGAASSALRDIVLAGRVPGKYRLQAKDPRTFRILATLDVDVLTKIDVTVSYFAVEDAQPGHRASSRTTLGRAFNAVTDLTRRANEILLPQANVEVFDRGPHRVAESLKDLGSRVDIRDVNTRTELRAVGPARVTDLAVYLVWGIKDNTEDAGLTLGNMTLLKTPPRADNDLGQILAHEIGHFLSADSDTPGKHDGSGDVGRENLMHDGLPSGTKLPRGRVLKFKVRPPASAPAGGTAQKSRQPIAAPGAE
jgi:hypothetical protein